MLVALQFEKNNASTIKNLLNSVNLDFKLFCSGTLEEVGESLMEKCNKCQNRITSLDSKEREKLWILFILKKKNGLFMLNLLETINVKTFQNVREFFDSEQLRCSICIGKNYRKRPLSLEEPHVTTSHLTMDKEVKTELEDETEQKAKKPVILRPRLVEIALVKASDIVYREDKKNENDVKKEENSEFPAIKRARIEVSNSEQKDDSLQKKVTVKHQRIVHMNLEADREKDNNSEGESSGERPPYKCQQCYRTYTDPSALNRHVKAYHKREKRFACEDCEMKFAGKSQLDNHKRTHDGLKPYECDVCKKKFSLKSELKTHTFVHAVVKPYQCRICGVAFSYLEPLNRHERVYHGKNEKEVNKQK